MTKKNKMRIVLYADEFKCDVWEEYCNIANVPASAENITLFFEPSLTDYEEPEGYWDFEDEEDE